MWKARVNTASPEYSKLWIFPSGIKLTSNLLYFVDSKWVYQSGEFSATFFIFLTYDMKNPSNHQRRSMKLWEVSWCCDTNNSKTIVFAMNISVFQSRWFCDISCHLLVVNFWFGNITFRFHYGRWKCENWTFWRTLLFLVKSDVWSLLISK